MLWFCSAQCKSRPNPRLHKSAGKLHSVAMSFHRMWHTGFAAMALVANLAGADAPAPGYRTNQSLHSSPAAPVALADRSTYLTAQSEELSRHWPTNRTMNIVCHGHSVPAGYFQTPRVESFNAYPHLLHRGLKERFPNAVLNVIVTAIGGENSESGARRFARDVLPLRPALVTIDYGLNDRGLGLERAAAAWSQMIREAKQAGIKVILLTPTPDTHAALGNPADPLNQHAEQIRRLAKENGLALVDSLAAFQQRVAAGEALDSFMSQFNHPNRKGHQLVAGELLKWWP